MNGFNLSGITNAMLGVAQVSHIYYGSNLIWQHASYTDSFYIESLEDNNTISLSVSKNLLKSTDGGITWTTVSDNTNIGTLNTGDRMLLRGDNSTMAMTTFSSTGTFNIGGDLRSLLSATAYGSMTTITTENAFRRLFRSSKVVDAYSLRCNASTFSSGCFWEMFMFCTSLTRAYIPGDNIFTSTNMCPENCYRGMFQGCSALTTINRLRVKYHGGANTCNAIFYQCSSMSPYNYFVMYFKNTVTYSEGCYKNSCAYTACTSNVTLSDNNSYLPANCFEGTFAYTNISRLNVYGTLSTECCKNICIGCTSLSQVNIYSTSISGATGCFTNAFKACSSLSTINAHFTDVNLDTDTSYTTDWVDGVAASGTYVKYNDYKLTGVSRIPTGWTVTDNTDYSQKYFAIESLADNNTISFNKTESAEAKTIYWSSDKTTWHSVSSSDAGTTLKTLSNNEKIYIKGSNNNYASSTTEYNYFSSNAAFNISGNIMSLIYGDNFIGQTTLPSDSYIFGNIFRNSQVVDTSNLILPATTLAEGCYYEMFNDCTSLTTAPVLPATTLTNYCYYRMFMHCTSLTTAPELPATTLASYCYYGMFYGCTSLTTAPVLPATTLAEGCYYRMFYNCTSLTTAPVLPATTLESYCYYYMFYNCSSLTTAPELPATTLASYCYYGMFYGCTSLTTAPELPATTLVSWCYRNMFTECTSLNYIKAMFTTKPSNTLTGKWVNNVAASGTFVKNSAATWDVTGYSGIPSGWTVQTADA